MRATSVINPDILDPKAYETEHEASDPNINANEASSSGAIHLHSSANSFLPAHDATTPLRTIVQDDLHQDTYWSSLDETEYFDLEQFATFPNELSLNNADDVHVGLDSYDSSLGHPQDDFWNLIEPSEELQRGPPVQQASAGGAKGNLDHGRRACHSVLSDAEGDAYDIADELTQKLTSRLGQLRISGNGQLRYYGVTSNLHMMSDGLLSLFTPAMRSPRERGEAAIQRAELGWDGDLSYEKHLIDLYFAWHDPFLHEVDRDIFEQHKEIYTSGRDTELYSPALENAMYVSWIPDTSALTAFVGSQSVLYTPPSNTHDLPPTPQTSLPRELRYIST